jgi:hypothetical protein
MAGTTPVMDKTRPESLTRRALRIGLGVVISGICLYLAARQVNFQDVWDVLCQADAYFIFMTLACVAANQLGKAFRWRLLLGAAGKQIGLPRILMSLLMGQMLNAFFPARIGDVGRIYGLGREKPGWAFAIGTVLVEKVLDMIAYALLFVTLLILMPLPGWISNSGYTLVGATILVSTLLFWIIIRREWVIRQFQWIIQRLPERFQTLAKDLPRSGLSSLDIFSSKTELFKLTAWTVLIWATAVLTNHLAFLAFGLNLPPTAALLTLIALQAGISIPSIPGRIGVFEYLCVLTLGIFGIGQTIALSYGILLHAIIFLPVILPGIFFYWFIELTGRHSDSFRASKSS